MREKGREKGRREVITLDFLASLFLMSTRAGRLSHSQHIKQRLVRLLYQPLRAKVETASSTLSPNPYDGCQGRTTHRRFLDAASYTYQDLKKEYLKRLHDIHPDKLNQEKKDKDGNQKKQYPHHSVGELVDAWNDYEALERTMRTSIQDKDSTRSVQHDFTLFGVGCSFADSKQEQEMRSDFMDQACQGWISNGQIPERLEDKNEVVGNSSSSVAAAKHDASLLQEDWFVEEEENHGKQEKDRNSKTPPPSLVDNSALSRKQR